MTGQGLRVRRRTGRLVATGCAFLGAAGLFAITGCGSFFQCTGKASCPTTTTGTGTSTASTVDFAFVASTSTAGVSTVTGYNLASGALTAINTVTLPFVPAAMVVNPANSRLYVASVPGAASPGIYEYSIGTDGTLTSANSGGVLFTDLVGAMAISPDGNYLYTLQSTGQTMIQYSVNTSTGVLAQAGSLIVPSLSCSLGVSTPVLPTCSVAVSPEGDHVVATLNTAGSVIFGYGKTTGITGSGAYTSIAAGTNSGDFSVGIDASDNAYIARTSTLAILNLPALVASPSTYVGSVFSFASGTVPRGVAVQTASGFVYTADVGLGEISGFSTSTTVAATLLTGAPFAAPARVSALGVDSTGTYLVAVGYDGTAGVQLNTIATTGALTVTKSQPTTTATQYPVLLAMSH